MSGLVIDIETVGEDFDALDDTTQSVLTRWIKKESSSDVEYQVALKDLKNGLGFSPLTGQTVVIGVYDTQKKLGTIYFQAPGQSIEEFTEDGITFKQRTEQGMLTDFWNGAIQYHEFITFNGRAFDIPFLMIRSAVHHVRVTKDLLSNRYLGSQKFNSKHIDLMDQLTFYGAVRRGCSLHLASRAFGITSPKQQGITGDDVGRLFKEGKCLEIARYNVGDLRATNELYQYWQSYLSFDGNTTHNVLWILH